jgi:integrase
MARGNITKRGAKSWRLKFEGGEPDPLTGKRLTRYVTLKGTKKAAQAELTRLLAEVDAGTAVSPSAVTVADYLRGWLDTADHLAGKTRERYRALAEQQIVPHLGAMALQRLRPIHIADWHTRLLRSGGKNGNPLSARTVGHAHRVLHTALARAAEHEVIGRNVASLVRPAKVEMEEIEILTTNQIGDLFTKLCGHRLLPIAALALGAGLRRGELCALRWGGLDLDEATLRVEYAIEQTRAGLKVKAPKSRHGRRTIKLPANVVEILRAHRSRQLEQRLALGAGRAGPEDLVFTLPDGSLWSPDYLSRVWRRTAISRCLPNVGLHALRHSHASALIAAGIDVLTISRRLGHGSPAFTLAVYGHLFANTDASAARAIDAAMGAADPDGANPVPIPRLYRAPVLLTD